MNNINMTSVIKYLKFYSEKYKTDNYNQTAELPLRRFHVHCRLYARHFTLLQLRIRHLQIISWTIEKGEANTIVSLSPTSRWRENVRFGFKFNLFFFNFIGFHIYKKLMDSVELTDEVKKFNYIYTIMTNWQNGKVKNNYGIKFYDYFYFNFYIII